jgi:hypothetical protein
VQCNGTMPVRCSLCCKQQPRRWTHLNLNISSPFTSHMVDSACLIRLCLDSACLIRLLSFFLFLCLDGSSLVGAVSWVHTWVLNG